MGKSEILRKAPKKRQTNILEPNRLKKRQILEIWLQKRQIGNPVTSRCHWRWPTNNVSRCNLYT